MTRADDDTTRGSIKDLARLLPWVRPYTASMVVMFSAALIGTLAGLAIPALTRNVIDGPIAQGDRAGLWWLGLLALAFGAVEAFLIYLRRLLVSRASRPRCAVTSTPTCSGCPCRSTTAGSRASCSAVPRPTSR